ncbi:hypothetical protein AGMMS49944_08210 [Spirochaetia bacterium]|nr:hypothetical protein AGMMS49944_08210 [Spirochaetia bacterium]
MKSLCDNCMEEDCLGCNSHKMSKIKGIDWKLIDVATEKLRKKVLNIMGRPLPKEDNQEQVQRHGTEPKTL